VDEVVEDEDEVVEVDHLIQLVKTNNLSAN
jgi:hypothetical protein